jgi:hypothetical protein
VLKHYFGRQAVATLLKFAKTTSDPQVASALVEKAAGLKERIGELPPPFTDVIDNHEAPQPRGSQAEAMIRDRDDLLLSMSVAYAALLLSGDLTWLADLRCFQLVKNGSSERSCDRWSRNDGLCRDKK